MTTKTTFTASTGEELCTKFDGSQYMTRRVSDGAIHNPDGPAVWYVNGDKWWWLNGEVHRVGGPAFESRNQRFYHQHDLFHREDGPAIMYFDENGRLYEAHFYTNGVCIRREAYDKEGRLHGDGGAAARIFVAPHEPGKLPSKVAKTEWWTHGVLVKST